MSITSTASHNLKVVVTVSSGVITLDDVEHYQSTVWLEPSIYGYNELYDFSDSDYSKVEFGDLITVAQNASKLYMLDPNSKFAFLTHNKNHEAVAEFYMAAKAMSTVPSRIIDTFKSKDEAMSWLMSR